jgi:hypothetical protein
MDSWNTLGISDALRRLTGKSVFAFRYDGYLSSTQMPVYRKRSLFDKFASQDKTPVFTVVSLLTNFAVWAVTTGDLMHQPENWGGLAQLFIFFLALAVGVFGSLIFGLIAVAREEYCGGRIVLLGMALWIFTILFIIFLRHGHLWQ